MRWVFGVAAVAGLIAACSGSALAAVVTGAHDNLRTGWYPDEPALAPSQITSARFKNAFTTPLQGQIYAQPLVANGTLLVVTEENRAYGIDPLSGQIRWEKTFGTAVEAGPEESGATIECEDLEPRVGITGTPVIDTESNVAYFVSNQYVSGGSGPIAWYMHALNLSTGAEVFAPVPIEGEARNHPGVKFVAKQELQRPALLMMNGVVYAAFGSHCDDVPYQGWIVGVSTSGQIKTMWAASAHETSIWQAGSGLVSDGPGQILFATANGSNSEPGIWDPSPGEAPLAAGKAGKLGESVVRVGVESSGELNVLDYFSPFNSKELDAEDLDLGSSGPIALPPQFGTTETAHLLVQEGKDGQVYLLNRDNLGGRAEGKNNILQEIEPYGAVFGTAAAWPGDGGYVYVPSFVLTSTLNKNHLRFFKYETVAGKPKLATAAETAKEEMQFGSGSPIVTSNETASGSGMVWISWCPTSPACQKAELRAYAAVPSGFEPAPQWSAPIGFATKFARPEAADGHIYVGNREGKIFGFSGPSLTASTASLELAAPVGGKATGEVTLTNTGSQLELEAEAPPTAPFQASGLPPVKTTLKPGEAVKVTITFAPTAAGPVNGSLTVVTPAGETKIAIKGVGEAAQQSVSLGPGTGPPAILGPLVEPIVKLTHLQVRATASRAHPRRRSLRVSYVLSGSATVRLVIERRVSAHNCPKHARRCFRWVASSLGRKVSGHAGTNVVALNAGHSAAGTYRLLATPLNHAGVRGSTRTLEFKLPR